MIAVRIARAAAVCITSVFVAAAHGQPAKDASTVRLIVPFAVGTPTDVTARLLGQGLAKGLGRAVIIDNRPGAANNIATEAAVVAPPDGQTLLVAGNAGITINPHIYSKLRFDPMKDLAPVALLATGPFMLVTSPNSGITSVAELINAAKAQPGTINYASYGPGSMSHVCAEIFQTITGTKLFHVPYKSGSLTDIMGGQITMGFEPTGPTIPQIQARKLNALGVTSPRRIEAAPEVKTLAESVPGFECLGWIGVLVPAKTPAETRESLSAQILKAIATPEFSRQMRDFGLTPQPAGEREFTQLVRQDYDKWGRVLKSLNISAD